MLKGDLRPPRHSCPQPGEGNPKDQRDVLTSTAGERSSKPPRAADAVGNGAGEQAGHSRSLFDRARPTRGSIPPAPCCSWPRSKPYCQKSKVREGNRARAGHAFSGCAFPACSLSGFLYLPDCLASLYHYHLLSPFLWLACPIYLQYPSPGMTPVDTPFPFSPVSPTNWLPVLVFTSQAISFCWRLAATHHLRGARNTMIIGAVSLPNKMALMELLFDLVCFVFFQRGTIKNQLRHFN